MNEKTEQNSNAVLCQMIAGAARESTHKRIDLIARQAELLKKLDEENLSYKEYVGISNDIEQLSYEIQKMRIESEVFDKVLKICLMASNGMASE